MVINEAYTALRSADQLLLSWLLSTLSQELLGQVTDCSTSFGIWSYFSKLIFTEIYGKSTSTQTRVTKREERITVYF